MVMFHLKYLRAYLFVNGSDDHSMRHFRVAVDQPLRLVQLQVDVRAKDQLVVVNVQVHQTQLGRRKFEHLHRDK